jgi:tetratricopeptide (TPR) repeat protein
VGLFFSRLIFHLQLDEICIRLKSIIKDKGLSMLSDTSKTTKYAVLCVLLLFIASAILASTLTTKKPVAAGTVITLPVQMELSNSASRFPATSTNPYALMDSIIQQLSASAQYPVLQVEDIVEILHRSSPNTLSQTHWDIERLFTVSGASLIIESLITEDLGNYQVSYVLHQKDQRTEGLLLASTLAKLVSSFTSLLNQTLGQPIKDNVTITASDFTQIDIITALEYIQEHRFDEAMALLVSLVNGDKNNLLASRLLIELQFKQGEFIAANNALAQAVNAARLSDKQGELAKLGLLSAQIHTELGDLETALIILSKAKANAASANDWQSLGRISLTAGQINLRLGRHDDAKTQFFSAVHYFQTIHCPYGKALSLNEIAQLEYIEHNYGKAYRHINQSLDIVTNRQLLTIEKATFALLKKIEAKLQR